MNVVFVGGTLRGYELYSVLIKENILPAYSVFMKEDEHEVIQYSQSLTELAVKYHLPHSTKKKLTEKDYTIISDIHADMVIVCGWRTLIEVEKVKNVKAGILAAHDSLLPKYRGFAPLNWAIINGETETGVTIFQINKGDVDSGDICIQKRVNIGLEEYAWDVYQKIIHATIDAYLEVFRLYSAGKLYFTKQNHLEATYTCKRCPDDGHIDWSKSSRDIYNLIRGIAHPYPGAFFYFKGQRYYVRKAALGDYNDKIYVGRIAGRVIRIYPDSVEVLCGSGSIKLLELENKEQQMLINPATIIKSITDTLQ